MRPPARLSVLFWCLSVGTVALLGKAVQVQVVHRDIWKAKALRQQTVHRAAPLFRGQITDVSGHTLAYSVPQVEISFAPRDVNQPQRMRGIFRQLGLGAAALNAITTDTAR
jgi:cell division protein FtsI (penicillin-binding protein 3)